MFEQVLTPLLSTRYVLLGLLCALWTCDAVSSDTNDASTRIIHDSGKAILSVGTQPFFIKGAVGWDRLSLLAAAGGNAVRVGASSNALDSAHKFGLKALTGLPLSIPRRGFDYGDSAKCREQRERIRKIVSSLKGHPAVLMWAIGNEPTIYTSKEQRILLWKEVNRIAEMIHQIDAGHPVISVIGGEQWRENLGEVDEHCPTLDAIGLNAYSDMLELPEALQKQGWKRPYLITEFGPRGHWQVPKTGWGARIEDNSTEKALFYEKAYRHAVLNRPQCLGAFAFLWGAKMEKTHTWYGMFLESGERTGSVDTMTQLWSGTPAANRCPEVKPPGIEAQIQNSTAGVTNIFPAGASIVCKICITDADDDSLSISWDLRKDVSDDPRVGGDYETLELPLEGAVTDYAQGTARIQLPQMPGKFRIFAYGKDGRGGVCTANVAILTK